jgi:hypothetical protein
MSRAAYRAFLLLLILLPVNLLFAGYEGRDDLGWLQVFFEKGIRSASAQYVEKSNVNPEDAEKIYQRSQYTIGFDFKTKVYTYNYSFEYSDLWSVLTRNEEGTPPKQTARFIGSKVSPWSLKDDVGTYSEVYTRTLPNWFVFDDLDSIVGRQCLMNNPLPAITGIFYADEFKALKRLYKSAMANGEVSGLWSCFDYDASGNVVEISRTWLQTLDAEQHISSGLFSSYSIVIYNNSGEAVFIDVLSSNENTPLMEGLCFRSGSPPDAGKNKASIYNFELNSLFHKFVPELVADPRELIRNYLEALQVQADRELMRFETAGN